MKDDDPLEAALRESLRANAGRAPGPDDVTDRILAAADGPTLLHDPHRRGRGRWRTWGLPLVAAASVAAVVGGVLALSHLDVGSDRDAAATSGPSPSPSVSRPAPVVVPSPSSAFSVPPTGGASTSTPADTSTLHGVRIVDLTFTGTDTGWALASATCIRTAGRCPALLHTDDGHTWDSRPGTPFTVPGDSGPGDRGPEVDHLRFATDDIGYAYGPDAFFMTTNGAQSWQRMSGGADALETLNGNVIRISGEDFQQPVVSRAAIGSATWTPITMPGGQVKPGVLGGNAYLSRTGNLVVLAITGYNPAKGSGVGQQATFYTSADDGETWNRRKDPCPAVGADLNDDAAAMTTASNGSIVVDCGVRSSLAADDTLSASIIVSKDGGDSYSSLTPDRSFDVADLIAAANSHTVIAYRLIDGTTAQKLFRTTDGGRSWSLLPDVSNDDVLYIGFESDRVGRIVTDGGRTIWTTRDAGRIWKSVTFG